MKKLFKALVLVLGISSLFYILDNNHKSQNDLLAFKTDNKKYIALTFDDGPHYKYTSLLLDGLKERNVKATFFVLGCNAEKNYSLLKRMADEGHLIGNHTYSHKNLYRLKETKIKEEIDKTNQIIEAITGKIPKYFRPSYGNYNGKILKLANMEAILWNVDSLDWKIKNSKRITYRVINKVNDGSIILMHDIYKSSVNAALLIIDKLQQEGYEFVTVEKLLNMA